MSRSIFQRIAGKCRRLASTRLARRPWIMRNKTPLISFTFDDFPTSAFEVGGRILESHGYRGTYYTSAGLLGQSAPTGSIIPGEQLPAVVAVGHELGCHTYAHCDAALTPAAEFERSIQENRQVLKQLVPGETLRSLSYPIGSPRPSIKRRSGRHYQGCRAGGQTHNAGKIDLNYLKAFFLEQAVSDPESIYAAIDRACEVNGWLIFATHDVAESPTRFGCTPRLFEEVVSAVAKSRARVLPVSKALEEIGIAPEQSQ